MVLAWRGFIIADTVQTVLQKHQINTHHLVEHTCERQKGNFRLHLASVVKKKKNSLDSGQNIYRGTIKVIHPHRKVTALQEQCKYKTWSAFLLSVFIFHQN